MENSILLCKRYFIKKVGVRNRRIGKNILNITSGLKYLFLSRFILFLFYYFILLASPINKQ